MDEGMVKIVLASMFGGSGLGAIALFIIQKKLNKKKEDVELAIKYQEFYREEIKQRELDKEEQKKEIDTLKIKLSEISDKLEKFVKQNKIFKEEIDSNKKNLSRWEEENEKLRSTINQKDKLIACQEEEIDELKTKL